MALTLSPALCALILKPSHRLEERIFCVLSIDCSCGPKRATPGPWPTFARSILSLAVFGIVGFLALTTVHVTPSGFLPDEDQGYFITVAQLPDGASKKRTVAVMDKLEEFFLSSPAVYGTNALVGQNFVFNTRGTYMATIFAPLKPWDERKDPQLHAKALIAGAFKEFGKFRDAVSCLQRSVYSRTRATGGFSVQLQDPSGGDFKKFAAVPRSLWQRPSKTRRSAASAPAFG